MEGKFDAHGFSPADVMRRLAEVERQLRSGQTARRMEAATIGAGGVRVVDGGNVTITGGALHVLDGDGQLVAVVGALPVSAGGGTGVAAIDPSTGALVSLSTLAFGMRAALNPNVLTITESSWGDPGTGPAGPTISGVRIGTSGRCAVWLGAELDPTIPDEQVGEVQMSVEVSGATSLPAGTTVVLSLGRRQSGTGNADIPSGTLGNGGLLTGLNAGLHTVTAQYQNTVSAGGSFVTNPTIIVIPF